MKKITFLLILFFVSFWSFAQNTCSTAVPITAGLHIVTSIDGTDVPTPICALNGVVSSNGKGEWYSYTPVENHTVTVTTNIVENTPTVDTRVHIYTGVCGSLTCLAGDDDTGEGYSSIVTFNVTAGTTYIIAFDNKWTANGFTFQLIEAPFVEPVPQRISYTTQTISTANSTYNLCVVDMNGDRKDDIVGVSSNALKIHYQEPEGIFTNATFPITGTSNMPSWSVAAGDYNKDGFNDLILGGGNAVTFWKSNSTGTAYINESFPQYVFCQRTNFVDLNNDGNLDAFSCHDVDPNVYYMNDGTGVLTFFQSGITAGAMTIGIHPEGGNYGSIFVDYDNDGDQDLFIAKCRGGGSTAKFNELHRNNGDGTFTDVSVAANLYDPVQTWSSAWADYDNDGDLDILIGASSTTDGTHKFMQNNGDSTFTDITAGSGWDTNTSTNIEHVAYDFDNDGFVDVLGGGNKIMFNLGNKTFAAEAHPGVSVGGIGDLNDDGFIDFLNGNTIRYAVPNANNWVKVSLQGIESNSYGIGARVEIYGTWGKQIREIHSGDGFKYMSSLNAHFGIGTHTAITKIVVKWPSGIEDVIYNPAINSRVHIIEESTVLNTENFANAAFSMYPNPAKNILNIKSNNAVIMTNAQVYDLAGKLIQSTRIVNDNINVESLSSGSYMLVLKDSNGKKYSRKFLKE
ncbi:FG-GAP-like repeat-containing protein [Flavobacterium sp. SM2513]|uniref:FG-GAP-like repeat-containing protein n=1 Tax=Flavobacterium sp. SM2513 TaxID=3424766 RepID=UPI003D7F6BDD